MTARTDRLRELCITVLYSGYAPIASGTWGSAVAILILAGLLALGANLNWPPLARDAGLFVGILLASVASVRWGPWALARYGAKDPKPFVLDEFAGQWTSLLFMPGMHNAPATNWAVVLVVQFVLFRVLDVAKPPPARQFERFPAGWGVLADDLMAGVYANLAGQVIWRVWPVSLWSAALGS
jgi:phosphatidylglycerophosphatase A